ncbi:hypothetical protein EDD16DRAFT_1528219 [Pisolithus croceorrhizus]|nr:hypothetical protein EDD16DRAFT_1528219 [Pisolithus croceorrhizus]KAI6168685.1 hypothetical protein EDD17DRAFT_1503480 [Pisolithus thermaeus]
MSLICNAGFIVPCHSEDAAMKAFSRSPISITPFSKTRVQDDCQAHRIRLREKPAFMMASRIPDVGRLKCSDRGWGRVWIYCNMPLCFTGVSNDLDGERATVPDYLSSFDDVLWPDLSRLDGVTLNSDDCLKDVSEEHLTDHTSRWGTIVRTFLGSWKLGRTAPKLIDVKDTRLLVLSQDAVDPDYRLDKIGSRASLVLKCVIKAIGVGQPAPRSPYEVLANKTKG